MRSICILCLLISVSFCAVYAQYTDRQKIFENKNIVWAAEIDLVISLDYTHNQLEHLHRAFGRSRVNDLHLLKFEAASINDSLNNWVANMLLDNPKIKRYKDERLEKRISKLPNEMVLKAINSTNPQTLKIKKENIKNTEIKRLVLKQYIYFDIAKLYFQTVPISLAPLYSKRDTNYNRVDYALFWVEPVVIANAPDLKTTKSITWAKRLGTDVTVHNLKTFKDHPDFEDITYILLDSIRYRQTPTIIHQYKTDLLAETLSDQLEKIATFEERDSLGCKQELCYEYKPDLYDYEEFPCVKCWEDKGNEFESIRLLQDWYWDEKAKQFKVYDFGFAQLRTKYDENGNFLHVAPIYYRFNKDN